MKFTILTRQQRNERERETYERWHKKFLWVPTRMSNNPTVVIWLGFALRKGEPIKFSPKIVWQWTYVESTFDVLKMDR